VLHFTGFGNVPARRVHVRLPSESDLAWELLDNVRGHLSVLEINTVAVHLSSYEFFDAVAALINSAARADAAIDVDLLRRLGRWLRRYDGHPDQARLEVLLNVRLQSARPTTAGLHRRG